MNPNVLTAVGDIFGGASVLAGAIGVIVAVVGIRAAARDNRQASEQQRQGAELNRQAVEQGRLEVAETRTARREEHLFHELERLARLIGLTKRMWSVNDSYARSGVVRSTPERLQQPDHAAEMDVLLYDFRAALAVFGRDAMPRCQRLADGHEGSTLIGKGEPVQAADIEVLDAISRVRQELQDLA